MESGFQTVVSSEVSAPALGFGGKLVNIFANPESTFNSLKEKPNWLAPFGLFLAIVFLTGLIATPYVMESIKRDTITFVNSFGNMPEEAMAKIEASFEDVDALSVGNIVKSALGAILSRSIPMFIVVSIMYFVGTVVFGGTAKYKQLLAVYAWTLPIWALSALVHLPLKIAKESYDISLSLAVFSAPDPLSSIHFLLKNINIFNIWGVVVLGVGFATLYGFGKAKGIITLAVLWGMWVVFNSFVPFANFYMSIMGLT